MTTPTPSIEERLARLEGSFEQIDRRLTTLEQDVRGLRADLNTRMDRLEERLDARTDRLEGQLNSRMDQLEGRLNSRMDRLESRMDRLFYGLLGAIAASILATVLTRVL
jgi:chromosome segregation ATPase